MERNGNKVLLTVIGIAVLIVATVGATFAYFSATGGTVTQNVNTGALKVSATSSLANGVNIKPTKWESTTAADSDTDVAKVGLSVDTNGTTIDTATYNINLTTTGIALNTADGKTGGKLSDVNWALYDTDTSTELATGTFESGNVTDHKINTTAISIPQDLDDAAGTAANIDNYKLYIWIEDDDTVQDQLQGLTITAKLTVDAIQ